MVAELAEEADEALDEAVEPEGLSLPELLVTGDMGGDLGSRSDRRRLHRLNLEFGGLADVGDLATCFMARGGAGG